MSRNSIQQNWYFCIYCNNLLWIDNFRNHSSCYNCKLNTGLEVNFALFDAKGSGPRLKFSELLYITFNKRYSERGIELFIGFETEDVKITSWGPAFGEEKLLFETKDITMFTPYNFQAKFLDNIQLF